MALINECRHGVPAGGNCYGCECDEQDEKGDQEYTRRREEEAGKEVK